MMSILLRGKKREEEGGIFLSPSSIQHCHPHHSLRRRRITYHHHHHHHHHLVEVGGGAVQRLLTALIFTATFLFLLSSSPTQLVAVVEADPGVGVIAIYYNPPEEWKKEARRQRQKNPPPPIGTSETRPILGDTIVVQYQFTGLFRPAILRNVTLWDFPGPRPPALTKTTFRKFVTKTAPHQQQEQQRQQLYLSHDDWTESGGRREGGGDPYLYVEIGGVSLAASFLNTATGQVDDNNGTHYSFDESGVYAVHEEDSSNAVTQLQEYYSYCAGNPPKTPTDTCSAHGACDQATYSCRCDAGWGDPNCGGSTSCKTQPGIVGIGTQTLEVFDKILTPESCCALLVTNFNFAYANFNHLSFRCEVFSNLTSIVNKTKEDEDRRHHRKKKDHETTKHPAAADTDEEEEIDTSSIPPDNFVLISYAPSSSSSSQGASSLGSDGRTGSSSVVSSSSPSTIESVGSSDSSGSKVGDDSDAYKGSSSSKKKKKLYNHIAVDVVGALCGCMLFVVGIVIVRRKTANTNSNKKGGGTLNGNEEEEAMDHDADEHTRLLLVGTTNINNKGPSSSLGEGKYLLLRVLGRGSFGVVYLVTSSADCARYKLLADENYDSTDLKIVEEKLFAEQQRRQQHQHNSIPLPPPLLFAMKVIQCDGDDEMLTAFNEFKALSLQGHPHIVPLVDMYMSYERRGGGGGVATGTNTKKTKQKRKKGKKENMTTNGRRPVGYNHQHQPKTPTSLVPPSRGGMGGPVSSKSKTGHSSAGTLQGGNDSSVTRKRGSNNNQQPTTTLTRQQHEESKR